MKALTTKPPRAACKDGNSGKNEGWRILGVLPGGTGANICHLTFDPTASSPQQFHRARVGP